MFVVVGNGALSPASFLGLVAFSSFFWVGGVPLAAFPLWFPRGSWVGGGAFLFCRFLHLASPLASRSTWSTDPQPPRPLQLLAFARPASPVSC